MSDEDGARRKIEIAIEQRQQAFILSYVARTDIGYILKFRQGIVDIVRSGIEESTNARSKRPVLIDCSMKCDPPFVT